MFRVLGIVFYGVICALVGFGFAVLGQRQLEADKRKARMQILRMFREDDELADPDFAGA